MVSSESPPRRNREVCAAAFTILRDKGARNLAERIRKAGAQLQIDRGESTVIEELVCGCGVGVPVAVTTIDWMNPGWLQDQVALDVIERTGVEIRCLQLAKPGSGDDQEEVSAGSSGDLKTAVGMGGAGGGNGLFAEQHNLGAADGSAGDIGDGTVNGCGRGERCARGDEKCGEKRRQRCAEGARGGLEVAGAREV